ncbi:tetratricopeptide repeat protein [Uliginosibacterium gangwonense]|uniref:tetratricopeptide repeat protein n=1 Tax=Uliginosibacterium gangwonense TaxID=392736 RepID=UPI0003635E69|nr:tetratricopeptide repeat protein [Uliginosibacterium gangwonense]
MNVQTILQQLDRYYQQDEHTRIEPFLLENIDKAQAANDKATALTLLNELMGYYRGMSRFQESITIANKAVALLEEMGYKGTIPYATTLLNVATAYRADGQIGKAIELYEEVIRIYNSQRQTDVYLMASLYNNLSLAYQELDDHAKAIQFLEQALPLIKSLPDSDVEVAVTYTNMALSKIKCARLPEAKADLLQAAGLFEAHTPLNSHYGAALAGLGEIAYREGNTQEAITRYERALSELLPHYGKNLYYAITLGSLAVVYEDVDQVKSQALAEEARQIQAALQ